MRVSCAFVNLLYVTKQSLTQPLRRINVNLYYKKTPKVFHPVKIYRFYVYSFCSIYNVCLTFC